MKILRWSAFACAAMLVTGCPQESPTRATIVPAQHAQATATPVAQTTATPAQVATGVALTLETPPFNASVDPGQAYTARLWGKWESNGDGTVFIQASDSAGIFASPHSVPAPKRSSYRIGLNLASPLDSGDYAGTLTVQACADAQCAQPYPGTMRSVEYTLHVASIGEWGTLQRNARHDGYAPVVLDPARIRMAWSWENQEAGPLSPVVTGGNQVFAAGSPSLFALDSATGVVKWRYRFNANKLNPPAVANGIVYAATTGHENTFIHSLRASDGQLQFQAPFYTQWAEILAPTVHAGRVFVNAGYYGGVVYAFDPLDSTRAWNASGGTYGMNTPAVDDTSVYTFNGTTLDVLDSGNGSLQASIGPQTGGRQVDYHGTVMLGSTDQVMALDGVGATWSTPGRQLVNYSIATRDVRWRSVRLYTDYPAVAKGVVYAASNESRTLDALDEATGRLLWSWKPPEQFPQFIGNVVVTDNLVFASTSTRLYAIGLRRVKRDTVWSAPTPGHLSISASRMLFVTSPYDYYGPRPRITAYTTN